MVPFFGSGRRPVIVRYSSAGATPTLAGLFGTAKPRRFTFEQTAPPCGLGRSGLPKGPGINHLSHTTGPVFRYKQTRFSAVAFGLRVRRSRLSYLCSQRRAGPSLPDLLGQPIQHASLPLGLRPRSVISRRGPFPATHADDGTSPFPATGRTRPLPLNASARRFGRSGAAASPLEPQASPGARSFRT